MPCDNTNFTVTDVCVCNCCDVVVCVKLTFTIHVVFFTVGNAPFYGVRLVMKNFAKLDRTQHYFSSGQSELAKVCG